MKKTIYKRMRLGGILLCLALIAACLIPTAAFADDTTVPEDSVHFINPTAITVVDDCLYVADVVEDGKTALLCFDISGANPVLKYTYDKIDGVVSGLSNNKQDAVYLNMGNKVVELNVGGEGLPAAGKTYNMPQTATSIIDVAYGKIPNLSDKTLYALTETVLYQFNESAQLFNTQMVHPIVDGKALLSLDEAPNYQLYYLSGAVKPVHRMNLSNGGQDSDFTEKKLTLTSGFTPLGTSRINGNVALYDNDSIYIIEETTSLASTTPLLTLNSLYASDCRISDVEAYGDRLFILNSKNKIDVFDKTEEAYNNQPTTTIGSDIVDKTVPTEYTSFTLARPNGYPANIVYKTNADTSVADIITDAKEYVVLGYDGDEESHYYYVLVGDKFGWVKKSDGAATPKEDAKLTVVKNNPGGVVGFEGEAKFLPLATVWVYELPLSSANKIAVTQTATTMKTVNVLQEYKEGDNVWYYVSYDEGKTGFVLSSSVGKIRIKPSTNDETEIIGRRKINSSLFAPVDVYRESTLTGELATDEHENEIKLYSGDRVTLIEIQDKAAFVMILRNDGSKDYGWVEASRLIEVHQITTNTTVGLSLLAAAVILATVLLVVYFKRKKRIKRNNG